MVMEIIQADFVRNTLKYPIKWLYFSVIAVKIKAFLVFPVCGRFSLLGQIVQNNYINKETNKQINK